jgi:HlyD family secretion protein
VRPQPLLVQGEVDATRLDIAARVEGRVGDIPVVRGQDVSAGAVLARIDNPETGELAQSLDREIALRTR